jgi:hypothetical protein
VEVEHAAVARSQEDLVREHLARAVRLVDAHADDDADLAAEALAIEIESELLVRLVDLGYADGDGDGCR